MRAYNKNAAIYEEYSLGQVMEWINDYCVKNLGRGGNLNRANLNRAELNDAKLNRANLNYAELNDAKLNRAELNYAELNRANLNRAELNDAKLNRAELNYAELNDAKLNRAELNDANVSNSTGFLNTKRWLDDNFKKTDRGYIVFKAIGNTSYAQNKNWEIKENSILEEEVNYIRTNSCGCGVNFGTMEFVGRNYSDATSVWECLLHFEDLCLLCVPYNTDGKARCGRLQLVKKIRG